MPATPYPAEVVVVPRRSRRGRVTLAILAAVGPGHGHCQPAGAARSPRPAGPRRRGAFRGGQARAREARGHADHGRPGRLQLHCRHPEGR